MFRFFRNLILFCFVGSAAIMMVDWFWFHAFKFCFGFLERHTGYWALTVVCAEIFIILIAIYKLTRWDLFYRWVMSSSWILPSYLALAYLCRDLSTNPHSVHSIDGFYRWQTATILASQKVYAARALPILTLVLAGLVAGLRKKRERESAAAQFQPELSLHCPHCMSAASVKSLEKSPLTKVKNGLILNFVHKKPPIDLRTWKNSRAGAQRWPTY